MSEWQPIDTAPRVEGEYLLGFDAETAEAHLDHSAGLCVISWIVADEEDRLEGFEDEWQVQPFAEGLDCIVSGHRLTHWMPIPAPPKQD